MKPVKPLDTSSSSATPSVISTSNQPPKRPALTRTAKTDKLPRLSCFKSPLNKVLVNLNCFWEVFMKKEKGLKKI